jgi:hypothetical protein
VRVCIFIHVLWCTHTHARTCVLRAHTHTCISHAYTITYTSLYTHPYAFLYACPCTTTYGYLHTFPHTYTYTVIVYLSERVVRREPVDASDGVGERVGGWAVEQMCASVCVCVCGWGGGGGEGDVNMGERGVWEIGDDGWLASHLEATHARVLLELDWAVGQCQLVDPNADVWCAR